MTPELQAQADEQRKLVGFLQGIATIMANHDAVSDHMIVDRIGEYIDENQPMLVEVGILNPDGSVAKRG